jgi:hypothetical protein
MTDNEQIQNPSRVNTSTPRDDSILNDSKALNRSHISVSEAMLGELENS